MSGHTPTPWEYVPSDKNHGPYIAGPFGGDVADLYVMSKPGEASVINGGPSKPIHHMGEDADANAEHIVRCVNSHDALVKALEAFIAQVGLLSGSGEYIRDNDASRQAIADARAALSAARTPATER